MKKILTNYCFAIVMMATACNPKVATVINNSFEPLAPSEPVKVLQITEEVPTEATLVGNLKVKDSGFSTNCSYETVIESAKMTARNNGCNLLKITRHLTPDIISTCHRIDALMYKMNWKYSRHLMRKALTMKPLQTMIARGKMGRKKIKYI